MPIGPQPALKAGLFGRSPTPRAPKTVTGKPPPPKPPPGVRIEHRVGVQASPETIWATIADLPSWARWNPTYPEAQGQIRIGATLTLFAALPGQAPRPVEYVVQDWVPGEQLLLKSTMLGGLIRTIRFIEIEKLAETGCIVSNGEIIGGFMGGSMARRIGRSIYRGMMAMNEALKAEAEARQQAAG